MREKTKISEFDGSFELADGTRTYVRASFWADLERARLDQELDLIGLDGSPDPKLADGRLDHFAWDLLVSGYGASIDNHVGSAEIPFPPEICAPDEVYDSYRTPEKLNRCLDPILPGCVDLVTSDDDEGQLSLPESAFLDTLYREWCRYGEEIKLEVYHDSGNSFFGRVKWDGTQIWADGCWPASGNGVPGSTACSSEGWAHFKSMLGRLVDTRK